MERNLALELVRLTEAAALAAARENGRGDEMAPERLAATAIETNFSALGVKGEIVVGSGHGGVLATGSILGEEGEEVDVAVNPLEGGISCALGGPNAMSIVAIASRGGFLRTPSNSYMEKIATSADGAGVVSLDQAPAVNLSRLAERRGVYVEDLTVVILDRPRHDDLIEEVRTAGARVKLIPHGDVAAAMAAAGPLGESGVDILMGEGGAAQGVLSAAAIRCMGGVMQCRFRVRGPGEAEQLRQAGVKDPGRLLDLEDMAGGTVMFAASGVTDGEYLKGVQFHKGGAISHSVVMRSESSTIRQLQTSHRFDYRPDY
jgi:fructose-1,6-bisphosphatase II